MARRVGLVCALGHLLQRHCELPGDALLGLRVQGDRVEHALVCGAPPAGPQLDRQAHGEVDLDGGRPHRVLRLGGGQGLPVVRDVDHGRLRLLVHAVQHSLDGDPAAHGRLLHVLLLGHPRDRHRPHVLQGVLRPGALLLPHGPHRLHPVHPRLWEGRAPKGAVPGARHVLHGLRLCVVPRDSILASALLHVGLHAQGPPGEAALGGHRGLPHLPAGGARHQLRHLGPWCQYLCRPLRRPVQSLWAPRARRRGLLRRLRFPGRPLRCPCPRCRWLRGHLRRPGRLLQRPRLWCPRRRPRVLRLRRPGCPVLLRSPGRTAAQPAGLRRLRCLVRGPRLAIRTVRRQKRACWD
mmetsp:Transcript_108352/g.288335  ORF Transcript_108352/g.288335 Transcript_108352/m.288335 type:complete len:351 (+) Transcript_108352:156-1208(+)